MEKSVDYAQFAKNLTSRAANAKDWQVRTKRLRAMREIAREIQVDGTYTCAIDSETGRDANNIIISA